jgi:hypothetical protein
MIHGELSLGPCRGVFDPFKAVRDSCGAVGDPCRAVGDLTDVITARMQSSVFFVREYLVCDTFTAVCTVPSI